MEVKKKVIASLNKCYACGTYAYDGVDHLLVAAEKQDPCYSFTLDGEYCDTLWDGPGGVMTVLQDPVSDCLLATQMFYSPNDSAKAKIVYYSKEGDAFKCQVLCDLPFVHRFGILHSEGKQYLVACTLKSAHAFKNDWTCPGRIWVGELDEIKKYNEANQLKLEALESGLYKNHGFVVHEDEDGSSFAVVGTENGVYQVIPPKNGKGFVCVKLLDTPCSDVLYLDFDQDGERELLVLSPFHGDRVSIYHKDKDGFRMVWQREKKMPFIHAICAGKHKDQIVAFVGNREGEKELIMIYYEDGYKIKLIDQGAGPANCMFFGDKMLLAANRESDEIALYELV